eukprot:CAMPEP_0204866180 /NCGR_PEP_ID=MMETSP1348-20121228/16237_1 /ASSEMBLY_ACC=CAM_ASM_000700 /TAXON_ID=215587 /ORGANISM="Aplanochytrium stocchinoi, Strain GSBS06" /LENGTH=373 /DNA_ID=CAMNT_0052017941 /DNA_START=13 /DNA_END=1134 /DNA_ORIENTATION=+
METASIVHQVKLPSGLPTDEDFEVTELPLPAVADGFVAVATTIISVDPYMRPRMGAWKGAKTPPTVFGGGSIGKVTESKAEGFSEGDLVIGMWGWADRAVCKAENIRKLGPHALAVPSSALNLYGSNGLTAYMGVEQIMKPKEGETVYVSGGAGSVGAVVGMLTKRRQNNITLIGSAGSASKLEYMLSIGYDEVFNYKEETVPAALKRLAPKGIDCYFDNVGGDTALAAVHKMNSGGRIAVCGAIHVYNAKNMYRKIGSKILFGSPFEIGLRKTIMMDFPLSIGKAYGGPQPEKTISLSGGRKITWKAFTVGAFYVSKEGREAEIKIAEWVKDGSLPNAGREDVVKGSLKDLPRTFARMLSGGNNGKQVLELV